MAWSAKNFWAAMRPLPKFEVGEWDFGFGDDLFEGADDGDGVHVVEEAEVGDAEELALHLALAVGDDGGELGFEALDEDAGVGAFGGEDGGGCGASAPLGAKSLKPSAVAAARVMAAQVSALSTSFLRPSARLPAGFSGVAACPAM